MHLKRKFDFLMIFILMQNNITVINAISNKTTSLFLKENRIYNGNS